MDDAVIAIEEKKKEAIALHDLAIEKVNTRVSSKAFSLFKSLADTVADDYVLLAYLGSCLTMKARDSWNLLTKMSDLHQGIALLDNAVKLDSDNIEIRLIRINNSMELPSFTGRIKMAKDDLQYLASLFHKDQDMGDTDSRGEVFFKLGLLLNNEKHYEDANRYLLLAIESSPNSTWSTQAQEILND